jgi:hypothetical protein
MSWLHLTSEDTPTTNTASQIPVVPLTTAATLTLLRALTRAAGATPQRLLPQASLRVVMCAVHCARLASSCLPGLCRGRRREPSIRRPADQRVVLADHGCSTGRRALVARVRGGRRASCRRWRTRATGSEAPDEKIEDHLDIEIALPVLALTCCIFGGGASGGGRVWLRSIHCISFIRLLLDSP